MNLDSLEPIPDIASPVAPIAEGTAAASARKTKICFARRHMIPGEFTLYDYMYRASSRDGVFRSDARRDAWDLGVNKDSITTWSKALEKKGWIAKVKDRERNPLTGTWTSIHYRVLSHEEWIKKHGAGQCRYLEDYFAGVQANRRSLSDKTGLEPESLQLSNPEQIENEGACDDSLSDKTGLEEANQRSLSENFRSTCPNPSVLPVRQNRTKRCTKESRKESEYEKDRSHLSPSAEENERLRDIVIAAAIETNAAATFSKQSMTAIERSIADTNATADELPFVIRSMVKQMDEFELHRAGVVIATNLKGHIGAHRKRAAAEAEREKAQAEKAAAERAKAEERAKLEAKASEWERAFTAAQPNSVHDSGSDPWVEDMRRWMEENKPPEVPHRPLTQWAESQLRTKADHGFRYCQCKTCDEFSHAEPHGEDAIIHSDMDDAGKIPW